MRSKARQRLVKALVCCQHLFLSMGVFALGYCVIVLAEAAFYQSWARQEMRAAAESFVKTKTWTDRLLLGDAILPRQETRPLSEMSEVGKLEIPDIGLSVMIAEGTSGRVLSRAVGHLRDTAFPGELGNVVLAGHRDTFFRRLGSLKTGDVIKVLTPQAQYVYGVRFTRVISPRETWVLDPSDGRTLTLVTCYPFYFIGPAPERFIVRASILPSPVTEAPLVRRMGAEGAVIKAAARAEKARS
jgi:sortase A